MVGSLGTMLILGGDKDGTVMLMGGRNGEPRDDVNMGWGRDGSMMLSGGQGWGHIDDINVEMLMLNRGQGLGA